MKRLALFCSLVAHPATAETYLCIADSAAGFRYQSESNKWISEIFKTDSKYIVRSKRSDDPEWVSGSYVLQEMGRDLIYDCGSDVESGAAFKCFGYGSSFTINPQSGKFITNYIGNYTYSQDYINQMISEGGKPDTPFIEIGRCDRI